MKTITTLFNVCIIATLMTFSLNSANGQTACNSPRLQFSNPTLVSGTALTVGAIYKFPNVMAGVDAYIKVVSATGGAYLVSMENPGTGYPDAWQPIVGGPSSPSGNRSAMKFEISFKTTAGVNYTFPCLDISTIDVDGDSNRIGEYIESDGHYSYSLPSGSLLVNTSLGSGAIRLQGPRSTKPGVDTSAFDVRGDFYFNGREKIELTLGSYIYPVASSGGSSTDRMGCVYFKKIVGSFLVLPVTWVSFDAKGNDKKVILDWATENEISNDHYEVERSFDNNEFKSIGLVMDAISSVNSRNSYKYMDNSIELKGRKVVYYRLKQVDVDQRATYSKVVAVKLNGENGVAMQTGPNPFVDRINIGFEAAANGNTEIRITNIAGKTMITKKYNVSNGYNNLQVNGLGTLSSGMYMVQVFVNGVAMDTQKMIKN